MEAITLWRSPSGMMHKSKGFYTPTFCGRKMYLSLKPLRWRRALMSEEKDNLIPRCKVCFREVGNDALV